jgi:hypothetical protein
MWISKESMTSPAPPCTQGVLLRSERENWAGRVFELKIGVVAQIGFDSYVDDLPSVDSKGLSDITCEVLVRINKQSPDIDGGVHVKTPATCGVGGWPTPPSACGVGGWPTPPFASGDQGDYVWIC